MYRNHFVFCLTSWFIVCIFTVTGGVTVGLTPEDIPTLERAIAMYKSNVGKIMNWRGKVIGELYEKGSSPASDKLEFFGKPIKISEISFCDDIVTENSLCIHRIVKNNTTEYHDEICTLFFDGVSYEISRYKDAKIDINRKLGYESPLAIKAVARKDLSRLLSTHFLPLEKLDFSNQCTGALERYITVTEEGFPLFNESSNVTVNKVDNLLVIEAFLEKYNLRARYYFDMQRSAMPVRFHQFRGNEHGQYWQCQLQNCDGIWVPEEISFVTTLSDGTHEWCKYIWKENIINAEIPKEVFSINSLGVHRGTTVYDYRTGDESILSDPKFPPMPDDHIEELKHISITRIVIITLGVILIFIAIIAKIVKRIKKNRL